MCMLRIVIWSIANSLIVCCTILHDSDVYEWFMNVGDTVADRISDASRKQFQLEH